VDALNAESDYDYYIKDDKFHVYCKSKKLASVIDPKIVAEKYSVDDVINVLNFRRPIIALLHMKRIVGYYSTTNNWNKSKLGEDKDRKRGNYRIDDQWEKSQKQNLKQGVEESS